MPCLNLSTNVNLDGVDTSAILSEATSSVAKLIGKPEAVRSPFLSSPSIYSLSFFCPRISESLVFYLLCRRIPMRFIYLINIFLPQSIILLNVGKILPFPYWVLYNLSYLLKSFTTGGNDHYPFKDLLEWGVFRGYWVTAFVYACFLCYEYG